MAREKRIFKIESLRATQAMGQGGTKLDGYAAMFNQMSADLGGFREQIAPGAFKKSLSMNEVCAFWSHDPSDVLGKTTSKTLRLMEDDFGLAFSIDLPDTQCGRDAAVSIGRGDVSGMSFGFDTMNDTWDRAEDGSALRTLLEVNLHEISPTPIPAYPQTSVSARALESLKNVQEEWAWELHLKTGIKVIDAQAEYESRRLRRKYFDQKINNL